MDIPAGVAVNAALTRQAIALEVVKMAADQEKQIASILEQAIDNIPVSGRGRSLDISV